MAGKLVRRRGLPTPRASNFCCRSRAGSATAAPTDRQGTSFETLSWASALLAATKEIVTFATVHVPLVNPMFAAKSV